MKNQFWQALWRCFEGFWWYIHIHKWICQTFTQFDVHWCFGTSTITFIINVSATVEIRNCQGTTSLDKFFFFCRGERMTPMSFVSFFFCLFHLSPILIGLYFTASFFLLNGEMWVLWYVRWTRESGWKHSWHKCIRSALLDEKQHRHLYFLRLLFIPDVFSV